MQPFQSKKFIALVGGLSILAFSWIFWNSKNKLSTLSTPLASKPPLISRVIEVPASQTLPTSIPTASSPFSAPSPDSAPLPVQAPSSDSPVVPTPAAAPTSTLETTALQLNAIATLPKLKPTHLAPLKGCYSLQYNRNSHKKGPSELDADETREQSNVFLLNLSNRPELTLPINPKSLCILINGKPIKHTIVKSQLFTLKTGPIARTNSKVTIRFCVGKSSCKEGCTALPQAKTNKDEFMNALGVDDEEAHSNIGWDGTADGSADGTTLDSEVRELAHEKEATVAQHKIVSDWTPGELGPACHTKQGEK